MNFISAQINSERQQQSWLRSRQKLTDHLRRQVEWYLGVPEKEIVAYRRLYFTDLRSGWKASKKSEIVKTIKTSSSLLLADFHGYLQSQRTHVRLLRSLNAKRPMVLFMECFDENHQDALDDFSAGRISEKVFLQRVYWQKNWPYPWAHYRPILQWALRAKVPLVAWSDFSKNYSLRERDQQMARKLNTWQKKHPDALLVGIVGELHLSKGHLPRHLQSEPVVVFQDLESMYFQLVRRNLETKVDVVRRRKKEFCVFTAPPWVKWQSFLLCLDAADDKELRQEYEATDHVMKLLNVLEADLGVSVPYSHLQVYTAQTLPNKYLKNPHIKRSLQTDQSFFLPKQRFAYLSRVSVNHAAYLAGLYLHSEMAQLSENLQDKSDFLKRVWQESLGFFACKLINHKRAANTLDEIRRSLARAEATAQVQKSLKLALQQRMNEIAYARGLGRKRVEVSSQPEVRLQACQLVGFMLGERMHLAFRRGQLGLDEVLSYFHKDVFASDFERFYYEVVRTLEPLDKWARDRSERL